MTVPVRWLAVLLGGSLALGAIALVWLAPGPGRAPHEAPASVDRDASGPREGVALLQAASGAAASRARPGGGASTAARGSGAQQEPPRGPPLDDLPDPLATLTPEQRAALCAALVAGDDGTALATCAASTDPALLGDLLATLDRLPSDAAGWARVLEAIAVLPGASVEVRVELLRARQSGSLERDRPLLGAVARMGGAPAVRLLLEVLGRASDPQAAAQLVARELDLTHGDEAVALLREALAAGGPGAQAAWALAGRREVSRVLVDTLLAHEPTAQEPRAALQSLAATGDPLALERVVQRAGDGTTAAVAQEALAGHAVGGPGACAVLLRALERSVEPRLRVALLTALGGVGVAMAEPALCAALAGGAAAERLAAARALGRVRAPGTQALDALASAYEGADEPLRREIRAALLAQPSQEARDRLQRLPAR